MEWMPGWGWGFKSSTDNGQIVAPQPFKLTVKEVRESLTRADEQRSKLLRDSLTGHTQYWDSTNPGAKFEHWRYADGWELGFRDAREFFAARVNGYLPSALGLGPGSGPSPFGGMDGASASHEPSNPAATSDTTPNDIADVVVGGDIIGALDLWVLKRMRSEGVANPQTCPFGWEFEHGLRKGVRDFEGLVGAR